jgi:hypothetical protein
MLLAMINTELLLRRPTLQAKSTNAQKFMSWIPMAFSIAISVINYILKMEAVPSDTAVRTWISPAEPGRVAQLV